MIIRRVFFLCCILIFYNGSVILAAPLGENERVVARLQEKQSSQQWSFAVLGDNRFSCRSCDWMYEKVLASMSRESFDFAVNTGDFVDSGQEGQYLGYLDRIRKLKFLTINILGNHDVPPGNIKDTSLFQKYFGPVNFYFDYQNARFIILNNAGHQFGPQQNRWLEKTLAEAGDRLKFVFMHIPTFNPSRRRSYLIKWDEDAELFEEIVRRYKVDIVFAGHVHCLYDKIHEGTRTIITGGGGAPVYEVPERGGVYHWVRIRVNGKTVQVEPVIIPTPLWASIIYRIVFFFNYDVRDNLRIYVPLFLVILILPAGVLWNIRRKRLSHGGKNVRKKTDNPKAG